MDPITIGLGAMAGMQAFGTGMQVKGQLDQAETAGRLADIDTATYNQNALYSEEQARFAQEQAGFAEEQAKIAEEQAGFARDEGRLLLGQGYEQGKEVRAAGTRLQSEARATVGAAGLKTDTGSPMLLAMESARLTEMDALTAEYEGTRGQYLAERQAVGAEREALASRRDAVGAQRGAVNFLRQGAESRRQGELVQFGKRIQKRNASMGAVGTVLGGVMNIAKPFIGGMGPSLAKG